LWFMLLRMALLALLRLLVLVLTTASLLAVELLRQVPAIIIILRPTAAVHPRGCRIARHSETTNTNTTPASSSSSSSRPAYSPRRRVNSSSGSGGGDERMAWRVIRR
ncbi:hypothetical protein Agub_g3920, partial [Astrephomene gubernaculifera]